ncbi:hypothetical protein A3A64_01540 [Candidatus Gottesmanbacteria bacterium RIFCSPLOWO2_01_FULL_48_11]|uniref:DNA-3-methyladenine glycosylase II n=3 Tax=Candidatus Gottesmaniibacteriota TaxID=1752720 RepID=A0A0G1WZY8_9BACT|nr:MAG: HhH-GPD family protein [Candidatus Gottesmanbacteria bacterium GW2011_GWA2_47_9]KKU95883.1 MAG: HhH-GPD family protein [Candidatus Gottesmanbacteria bacterium GW2011_GWA1_48_13]OGG26585.1 MAG: hypothetical protein A3A64_01540 [Candidatus Gottesmanbacteria bacterium RIFCSPLOWO2_01_FULL_48_11]
MDNRVIAHFKKADPVLARLLQQLPDTSGLTPTTTTDYFSDLVETIICQQLSDKAGATIFGRVQNLFPKKRITAKYLLKISDERLRSVGPSQSKVRYIKGLAKSVTEKAIDLEAVSNMGDEEVITELTKLKGIGPWTAEMFLMFALGRKDVFSHGDLGLRNAIKKLYGFKKEPSKNQIEKLTRKWSPYRTYACRILWKSLELPDIVKK